ncbi:MAG TPA: tail fiber domain-containing protein, partial [Flavitalea sp.]|nr:tail fiber domain-containing protein [Flavitalea sp.]
NGLYVAGKVGLGVKEPTARLDIAGTNSNVTLLNVFGGGIRVNTNWATGDDAVGISSNGSIGVVGSGMTGIYGMGMAGVAGEGTYGVLGVAIDDGSSYGGVFRSNYRALRVEGNADFYGSVWSSGGYITSDRNLKQDVTEFEDAMAIIGKLKPRNYQFKRDPKYAFLSLPEGIHYGLLAQDVEEVLPNLVSTTTHQALDLAKPGSTSNAPALAQRQKGALISIKAVNYVELIPIMIKAMQEEQAKNSDLKEQLANQQHQITELRQLILDLKNGTRTTASIGAFLEQNSPNPVHGHTLIRYTIPQTTSDAYLSITNVNGQLIKTVTISNKGYGQLNLDTSPLASGTYNYTLYIDGKQVDSKQLVIAR